MAVYFPRGELPFLSIREKFENDLKGVEENQAVGIAFVTNQELRLSERELLLSLAPKYEVELFHLERVAAVLDRPDMHQVRKQFLGIGEDEAVQLALGGEGGNAPGAGGGGGGAVGEGARGGEGGHGGRQFPLALLDLPSMYELFRQRLAGKVPGAGGGGGPATGPNAVGGPGGGGGDAIVAFLDRRRLEAVGISRARVRVGEGVRASKRKWWISDGTKAGCVRLVRLTASADYFLIPLFQGRRG